MLELLPSELVLVVLRGLAVVRVERPVLRGRPIREPVLDLVVQKRPPALGFARTRVRHPADEDPRRLDDYYAALERVDPLIVERAVNQMSAVATDRLAAFIHLFQRERILTDYRDSQGLRMRLNQVLRRVKLMPLPEEALRVLEEGRQVVRDRMADLLPMDRFHLPCVLIKDSPP